MSAAREEWAGRHWLESGVGSALALRLGTAAGRKGRVEHRVGGGGGHHVILTWGGALTLIPGSWSVPASKSHGPPPLLRCIRI